MPENNSSSEALIRLKMVLEENAKDLAKEVESIIDVLEDSAALRVHLTFDQKQLDWLNDLKKELKTISSAFKDLDSNSTKSVKDFQKAMENLANLNKNMFEVTQSADRGISSTSKSLSRLIEFQKKVNGKGFKELRTELEALTLQGKSTKSFSLDYYELKAQMSVVADLISKTKEYKELSESEKQGIRSNIVTRLFNESDTSGMEFYLSGAQQLVSLLGQVSSAIVSMRDNMERLTKVMANVFEPIYALDQHGNKIKADTGGYLIKEQSAFQQLADVIQDTTSELHEFIEEYKRVQEQSQKSNIPQTKAQVQNTKSLQDQLVYLEQIRTYSKQSTRTLGMKDELISFREDYDRILVTLEDGTIKTITSLKSLNDEFEEIEARAVKISNIRFYDSVNGTKQDRLLASAQQLADDAEAKLLSVGIDKDINLVPVLDAEQFATIADEKLSGIQIDKKIDLTVGAVVDADKQKVGTDKVKHAIDEIVQEYQKLIALRQEAIDRSTDGRNVEDERMGFHAYGYPDAGLSDHDLYDELEPKEIKDLAKKYVAALKNADVQTKDEIYSFVYNLGAGWDLLTKTQREKLKAFELSYAAEFTRYDTLLDPLLTSEFPSQVGDMVINKMKALGLTASKQFINSVVQGLTVGGSTDDIFSIFEKKYKSRLSTTKTKDNKTTTIPIKLELDDTDKTAIVSKIDEIRTETLKEPITVKFDIPESEKQSLVTEVGAITPQVDVKLNVTETEKSNLSSEISKIPAQITVDLAGSDTLKQQLDVSDYVDSFQTIAKELTTISQLDLSVLDKLRINGQGTQSSSLGQIKNQTQTPRVSSTRDSSEPHENSGETSKLVEGILYHYGLLNRDNPSSRKSHQFGDEVTAFASGVRNGNRGRADGTGTYVTDEISALSKIIPDDFKQFFAIDVSKLKLYETRIESEAQAFYDFQHKLEQFVLASGSGFKGFDENIKGVNVSTLYDEAKVIFSQYPEMFNAVFSDITSFENFINEMISLVQKSGLKNDGSFNASKLFNFKKQYGTDDIKTRFMKHLGFEGTNLSGTSFGSLQSGSVIYDLDFDTIISKGKQILEIIQQINAMGFASDLEKSKKFVNDIKQAFLDIVGRTNNRDALLEKYPQLSEFKNKRSVDKARDFLDTDEWNDFLSTLPQAHAYLESIEYDFSRIYKLTDEEITWFKGLSPEYILNKGWTVNTKGLPDKEYYNEIREEYNKVQASNIPVIEAETAALGEQAQVQSELNNEIREGNELAHHNNTSGTSQNAPELDANINDFNSQNYIQYLHTISSSISTTLAQIDAQINEIVNKNKELVIVGSDQMVARLTEVQGLVQSIRAQLLALSLKPIDIDVMLNSGDATVLTNGLENISSYLGSIKTLVDGINGNQISLHMAIDNSVIKSLRSINNALNINPNKINSKYKSVYVSLQKFVKNVNKLKLNNDNVLDKIRNVLQKSKELENLAKVLANSNNNINNAANAVNQPNSNPSNTGSAPNSSNNSNAKDNIVETLKLATRLEKDLMPLKAKQGAGLDLTPTQFAKMQELEAKQLANAPALAAILQQVTVLTREQTQAFNDYNATIQQSSEYIKNFAQQQELLSKQEKPINAKTRDSFVNQINTWLQFSTKVAPQTREQMKSLLSQMNFAQTTQEFETLRLQILDIQKAEIAAGRGARSFTDMLSMSWRNMARYFMSFGGVYEIINVFRRAFTSIREFDTALTEMRKVSDESRQSLIRYQKETFKTADAIGSTSLALQEATADWMRLGESIDEAAKSAEVSTILLNVSEFENIADANKALISASQAYSDLSKIEIVDVLNNIGNNYSVATNELAQGLQDAAAVLKTQGNDLNEAIALLTAGNAVTQDISKTAGGIRTIALRIAGSEAAKAELEEMGEDVDDFVVQTTAKMQQLIKEYTAVESNAYKGVDILNDNGNLKKTYQILLDISKVYAEILETDKQRGTNRGQALVEAIAGKNRSNIAASILSNPELLENVYLSAQDSAGSAQEELEKFLDSVDGHILRLQNSIQQLYQDLVSSGFIKGIIDAGKGLVDILDMIVKNFGFLRTSVAAFIGFLMSRSKGFFGINLEVEEAKLAYEQLRKTMDTCKLSADEAIKKLDITNSYVTDYVRNTDLASQSTKAFGQQLRFVIAKQKVLNTLQRMAAGLGWTAVVWAATSVIKYGWKAFDQAFINASEAIQISKEALEEFNGTMSQLKSDKEYINEISEEFDTLSKGVNHFGENVSLTTEQFARYKTLSNEIANKFPTLISGWDAQNNAIIRTTDSLKAMNEAYDENRIKAYNELIGVGETGEDDNGAAIVKRYQGIINDSTFKNSVSDEIKILEAIANVQSKDDLLAISKQLGNTKNLSSNSAWQKSLAGHVGKHGIGSVTDDQLAQIKLQAKSLKVEYEAQAQSALSDMRTLANAYLELNFLTNEDYKNVDENSKKFASLIVNNLSENVANQFANKDDVGKYVINLLDMISNGTDNEEVSKAIYELMTTDFAKMNPRDAKALVDQLIDTIASVINESPIELKVKLGLADTDTLNANYDTIMTKAAEKYSGYSYEYDSGDEYAADVIKAKYSEIDEFAREQSINTQEEMALWNKIVEETATFEEAKKKYIEAINDNKHSFSDIFALEDSNGDATNLGKLNEQIDKLQTAAQGLKSVMDTYNETGKITIDQLQDVLSYGDEYLKYLFNENGELELNKEAIVRVAKAKLQDMKIDALRNLKDNLEGIQSLEEANDFLAQSITDVTVANANGIKTEYLAIAQQKAAALHAGDLAAQERLVAEAMERFNNVAKLFDVVDLDSILGDDATAANKLAKAFENVKSKFEDLVNIIDSNVNLITDHISKLETQGATVGRSLYEELQQINRVKYNTLTDELKELEQARQRALDSGSVKEGSEQLLEMDAAIFEVKSSIIQADDEWEDLQNKIQQLHWDSLDRLNDKLQTLADETANVVDLLDLEEVLRDEGMGSWTDEAITAMAMYGEQLEIAQYQVNKYSEEIEYLKQEFANSTGLYGEAGMTVEEYNEKLNELTSGQWDAIKSYKASKDALVELRKKGVEEHISALEKLNEKQKEAWQTEKDAREWEKNQQKSEENLAKLRNQIAELENDTSLAGIQKRKELEAQLTEDEQAWEDELYDHAYEEREKKLDETLESQKEQLNNSLKDIESLVSSSLSLVNQNTTTVLATLSNVSAQYGVQLSNDLTQPFVEGSQALSNYSALFMPATSEFTNRLNGISAATYSIQTMADLAADSIRNLLGVEDTHLESTLSRVKNAIEEIQRLSGDGDIGGIGKTSSLSRVNYTILEAKYKSDTVGGKITATQHYAKGTTHASRGLHPTFENGIEAIMAPDGHLLIPYSGGEHVFTNEQTKNLFNMSKNPFGFIANRFRDSALANAPKVVNQSVATVQNIQSLVTVEGDMTPDVLKQITENKNIVNKIKSIAMQGNVEALQSRGFRIK